MTYPEGKVTRCIRTPHLSAWQLTIMAIVPVAALFAWLIAIYVAAREPGGQTRRRPVHPRGSATAGTGSRTPAEVGEPEPDGRPPTGGRLVRSAGCHGRRSRRADPVTRWSRPR